MATVDGTGDAVTAGVASVLCVTVPEGCVHPEQTSRAPMTRARTRKCLCKIMEYPLSSVQKKGLQNKIVSGSLWGLLIGLATKYVEGREYNYDRNDAGHYDPCSMSS